MLMYTVLMLVAEMISTRWTQHAMILALPAVLLSYHTYSGLTMLVYIYTAMLFGAMSRHHNDQQVWATCRVYDSSLPHQNDGYNPDTCVTLQVGTSYCTRCAATPWNSSATEAYTCILQCWQAHQEQIFAVWRSHYLLKAHNGTTVLWLQACMRLSGYLQTQDSWWAQRVKWIWAGLLHCFAAAAEQGWHVKC